MLLTFPGLSLTVTRDRRAKAVRYEKIWKICEHLQLNSLTIRVTTFMRNISFHSQQLFNTLKNLDLTKYKKKQPNTYLIAPHCLPEQMDLVSADWGVIWWNVSLLVTGGFYIHFHVLNGFPREDPIRQSVFCNLCNEAHIHEVVILVCRNRL